MGIGLASNAYLYLDARVAAETLKKVVLHSVAIAFASMVLPVPGGPNKRIPYSNNQLLHAFQKVVAILVQDSASLGQRTRD